MSLTELKQMPGHMMRRVQQISTALFAEEMADFNLTSVQFMALVAIGDVPDLDATRLAELIDFDKATIGGVIERLERKRLIERKVSAEDRRVKRLRLTPAGRALVTVSFDRVRRVQQRLTEPLDEAERVVLERLIRKLVEGLAEADKSLSEEY